MPRVIGYVVAVQFAPGPSYANEMGYEHGFGPHVITDADTAMRRYQKAEREGHTWIKIRPVIEHDDLSDAEVRTMMAHELRTRKRITDDDLVLLGLAARVATSAAKRKAKRKAA